MTVKEEKFKSHLQELLDKWVMKPVTFPEAVRVVTQSDEEVENNRIAIDEQVNLFLLGEPHD